MPQPNPLLWTAIAYRRMIRLVYRGKKRFVEPHDHGIRNGTLQLLGYQIAGASSRALPKWLLMKTSEISELVVLDHTFAGGRPTVSGRHLKWDKLFIRVKRGKE